MSNHKILIIGKNGQVGWELCRSLQALGEIVHIDYPDIDLSDPKSIRACLHQAQPRIVVNAAAYTAVDKAESEPALAQAINATAPGIIAEETKKLGGLLVHYSTDYVYDGAKTEPYVESDQPNPLGVYGRTKLLGDQAVEAAGCNHIILRTSWVYGSRGKNFLLTILRLAKEKPELRIIDDQTGSPTTSRMLAEVTSQILAQLARANDLSIRSLYLASSSGQTTWFGFAKAALDRLLTPDLKRPVLRPISTAEYPLPAPRPAYSVFSKSKLTHDFGLQPPHWLYSLDLVCQEVSASR
jgi:dTDP-4-dehydrorhamnose reductase